MIPTFNERRNLAELVAQLTALLDPELGDDYELIVVDDDSPDRTWELASELAGKYSKLRVLRREDERGLSTAVIRGWQIARGDVLAVIDADLQHPPEVTVELWRAMTRGAELAVGSRHIQGGGVSDWSLLRRLLSRGAQLLGLMLLPGVLGRVSDPMSGYFMIRRDAIAGVAMHPLGYKILVEVIGRGKVRWIAEVGYVFRERDRRARARSPGASTSTTCATSCACASRRCRRPASSASRWWAHPAWSSTWRCCSCSAIRARSASA